MRCPECHDKTTVVDSRPNGGTTMRRRECNECHSRFTTVETLSEMAYTVTVDTKAIEDAYKTYWSKGDYSDHVPPAPGVVPDLRSTRDGTE
jgi:hypothetical protein